MGILDRYIVRQFLLNLAILFVVVMVLIILVELLGNFDEFVQAGQKSGGGFAGTLLAIFDFYWPQVFLYAQHLAGLVPAGAAAFTLMALYRNRELVALMAGGVSLHRVAMPLLAAGFGLSLLTLANQELVLPSLAERLARSRAEIKHGNRLRSFAVEFVPDNRGRLFAAARFDPNAKTLHGLTVLVRQPLDRSGDRYGRAIERISAASAAWNDKAGVWELTEGFTIPLQVQSAAGREGEAATLRPLTPVDRLETDLDPTALLMYNRARFRQLLSRSDLDELIRHPPRVVSVRQLQGIRHSRFSQVILNVVLLAVWIPFFLVRSPQNMFLRSVKAMGLGFACWGGSILMLQTSPDALPAVLAWLSPAALAWLPVAALIPLVCGLWTSVET